MTIAKPILPTADASANCEASLAKLSPRKQEIRRRADASAHDRATWRRRGAFFHSEDLQFLRFLIPEGARVLELGCSTGELLAALKPSFGVGVDLSGVAVEQARKAFPDVSFRVGDVEDFDFVRSLPGPFDFIVIVDTLGSLDDCQRMFENLHDLCTRETRVIVGYFSYGWHPLLKVAEWLRLKMPQPPQNVLAVGDVRALAALADFEAIKSERRLLSPVGLFGLGRLINRFLAPLPLLNSLCLRHYTVCRSLRRLGDDPKTVSIVIPARNERGNIEAAVRRIPRFARDAEIKADVPGRMTGDRGQFIHRRAEASRGTRPIEPVDAEPLWRVRPTSGSKDGPPEDVAGASSLHRPTSPSTALPATNASISALRAGSGGRRSVQ
jgi:SAM-dependent methyltransferase